MDELFILAIVELTLFSLLALSVKSKTKILLILSTGIIISWYIGMVRVELFNELALQEYQDGIRDKLPSDGASNVSSLYLGWLPGLIYSGVVYGAGCGLQKYFRSKLFEIK